MLADQNYIETIRRLKEEGAEYIDCAPARTADSPRPSAYCEKVLESFPFVCRTP